MYLELKNNNKITINNDFIYELSNLKINKNNKTILLNSLENNKNFFYVVFDYLYNNYKLTKKEKEKYFLFFNNEGLKKYNIVLKNEQLFEYYSVNNIFPKNHIFTLDFIKNISPDKFEENAIIFKYYINLYLKKLTINQILSINDKLTFFNFNFLEITNFIENKKFKNIFKKKWINKINLEKKSYSYFFKKFDFKKEDIDFLKLILTNETSKKTKYNDMIKILKNMENYISTSDYFLIYNFKDLECIESLNKELIQDKIKSHFKDYLTNETKNNKKEINLIYFIKEFNFKNIEQFKKIFTYKFINELIMLCYDNKKICYININNLIFDFNTNKNNLLVLINNYIFKIIYSIFIKEYNNENYYYSNELFSLLYNQEYLKMPFIQNFIKNDLINLKSLNIIPLNIFNEVSNDVLNLLFLDKTEDKFLLLKYLQINLYINNDYLINIYNEYTNYYSNDKLLLNRNLDMSKISLNKNIDFCLEESNSNYSLDDIHILLSNKILISKKIIKNNLTNKNITEKQLILNINNTININSNNTTQTPLIEIIKKFDFKQETLKNLKKEIISNDFEYLSNLKLKKNENKYYLEINNKKLILNFKDIYQIYNLCINKNYFSLNLLLSFINYDKNNYNKFFQKSKKSNQLLFLILLKKSVITSFDQKINLKDYINDNDLIDVLIKLENKYENNIVFLLEKINDFFEDFKIEYLDKSFIENLLLKTTHLFKVLMLKNNFLNNYSEILINILKQKYKNKYIHYLLENRQIIDYTLLEDKNYELSNFIDYLINKLIIDKDYYSLNYLIIYIKEYNLILENTEEIYQNIILNYITYNYNNKLSKIVNFLEKEKINEILDNKNIINNKKLIKI